MSEKGLKHLSDSPSGCNIGYSLHLYLHLHLQHHLQLQLPIKIEFFEKYYDILGSLNVEKPKINPMLHILSLSGKMEDIN